MLVPTKENQCVYTDQSGTVTRFFNIYQAKNGSVMMHMHNGCTVLTPRQIGELGINVYYLPDFVEADYLSFYAKNRSFN